MRTNLLEKVRCPHCWSMIGWKEKILENHIMEGICQDCETRFWFNIPSVKEYSTTPEKGYYYSMMNCFDKKENSNVKFQM